MTDTGCTWVKSIIYDAAAGIGALVIIMVGTPALPVPVQSFSRWIAYVGAWSLIMVLVLTFLRCVTLSIIQRDEVSKYWTALVGLIIVSVLLLCPCFAAGLAIAVAAYG
ncbi:MAG: hypothetical protein KKA73_31295 [Chloroflexi bacterium]|nr:hypothetical protein [Chloroflexota bacterium]MBU1752188.1 hypothetical protein [Chloroflexota bacterium]